MKYRAYRILDGKPKWIVVDENGEIIKRNPSKDELKNIKNEPRRPQDTRRKYADDELCHICKIEILVPGKSYREFDKGNFTGKWLCKKCYGKDYQKNDINSQHNLIKAMSQRRMSGLGDRANILGDNCEELTCRWRGVKNLNIENDNYKSPIDHSKDPEFGIIQTKGAICNENDNRWSINVYKENGKEFDYVICYCISKDGNFVERIYIFPKIEINGMSGISIRYNPSKGRLWYEKYRVKDEDVLKKVNDIWQQILKDKCLL